jgi:hypothetical protein
MRRFSTLSLFHMDSTCQSQSHSKVSGLFFMAISRFFSGSTFGNPFPLLFLVFLPLSRRILVTS